MRPKITFLLRRLLLVTLALGTVSLWSATSAMAADDCCGCRLELGANGCTISNSACTAACPTATKPPNPATNTPQPTVPSGQPTNTPPPGGGGGPVGECDVCDTDCSAGATASYWQARQWPSNSGQCCKVCNATDWCQYSGWTCDGGGSNCPKYMNCKGWDEDDNLDCDKETTCDGPDNPCSSSHTSECFGGTQCFERCPAPPVQPTFTPTNTPAPTPTMPPVSGLTASCTAFGGPIDLNWSYSSPAEFRVIPSPLRVRVPKGAGN